LPAEFNTFFLSLLGFERGGKGTAMESLLLQFLSLVLRWQYCWNTCRHLSF